MSETSAIESLDEYIDRLKQRCCRLIEEVCVQRERADVAEAQLKEAREYLAKST